MHRSSKPIRKGQDPDHMAEQVRRLLEEKGRKTQELARKSMLEDVERIRCRKVREALVYFASKYWSDLIRPTLMSLSIEAAGGNKRRVASAAAPIMLIAAGVDIHDDIIDQSSEKNGRLTVYGKFGKEIALLVGDSLLFQGFTQLNQVLSGLSRRIAREILTMMKEAFFELGDAEALELPERAKISTSPEEYLRITQRKAADVEAYAHASAILGGGRKKETEALREYGRALGMIAILRDDLIDMEDGKELMNRLRNEIAPLPVLYAAQEPTAEAEIKAIMSKEKSLVTSALKLRKIVAHNGGFEKTRLQMDTLAEKGLSSIRSIKHGKQGLELLINFTKAA